MLDLIEHTNQDIVILMGMAFCIGFIAAITLCYLPVRTELDTIKRNWDREERLKLYNKRMERSKFAGEYLSRYPIK